MQDDVGTAGHRRSSSDECNLSLACQGCPRDINQDGFIDGNEVALALSELLWTIELGLSYSAKASLRGHTAQLQGELYVSSRHHCVEEYCAQTMLLVLLLGSPFVG
eukprot:6144516-Amphidinium_carterae.1